MSAHCCLAPAPAVDPRYRRILWMALLVNAAMFVAEITAGLHAQSVSLLADAVDFFGDAANYAVSLAVLAMLPVWRSRAALLKGLTMSAFGVFVLAKAAWNATAGVLPEPVIMGTVGFVALLANVSVAAMLYRYRTGDANMRSVWLCSRNDAIGNIAVMLAALGVFGMRSGWPDIIVAAIMGLLALIAAISVIRQAIRELTPAVSPRRAGFSD